jgi:TPR repeat protein
LDEAMRRNLAWLRPYAFGTVLAGILTFDLSNQWEVPVSHLPREFFERYVDGFDPHADPAVLLALAEKGNVQAQYVYALRHTAYAPVELQIKEDRELAFRWTLKAADGGHSRAMAVVALYYFRGTGTAKNLTEAKKWADQAVAKGQPMGFRVLGDLRREEARALKAASATADNKKALSDYETAMKEAFAYYRRGADAGERIALRMMSEGHDEGVPGMPRNYELGTELLRRSAMRRDLTAIRAMAERLEKGVKAPRDLSQAYAWRLVLSQLTGVDKDAAELARLEGTMGLPEIQRGQNDAAKILKELPSEAADALSRLHTSR